MDGRTRLSCGYLLDAKVTFCSVKSSNRNTKSYSNCGIISCAYPYFHIHSSLWHSNSIISKGKILHLSSQNLILFLSPLFSYFPPSSLVTAHFQESWACTHWILSHHSRKKSPWAHPLFQPSRGRVQPHSDRSLWSGWWAACWGNPIGLKLMQTEGGL